MAAGVVGIEEGFDRAVGIPAKQLFADWQESARELYNPVVQSRTDLPAPLIGKKGIPGKKGEKRRGSELNVGPALSPDGRLLAFISARDLFSIDLYLADAKTGHIERRLVSSDADSHFDSLSFIQSGGSWSPDGSRVAFITFSEGDNFLALIDVNSRKIETISVPGVQAISAVSWSPDGRTLAISGQMTGVSDLFLYDLQTKEVRRLTQDKFADLQPAFSPDGRTIAFVTDRRAGDALDQLLQPAEHGIATVDVDTGRVRELPLFGNAKHINPQWSPDGGSIYFIANPEGIPDIYRYNLASGSIGRVTAVKTGIAGITDISPAMTVASRSGDIAFSLFEDDNYNIYTLPASAPSTPVSVADMGGATPRAAILPPLRATGSEITGYLNRPTEGLPPANVRFEERPYSADLRLAYLGPPTIGATVGQYGSVAGGTVSAFFSDILGQHNVGFTFQGGGYATSNFADQLAGEVFYLNQKHRFNWGADLQHIPYVTPFYDYGRETIDLNGRPVVADVYSEIRHIQTITDVTGLAQYPFSTTRRIEGAAGIQRYSDKFEAERFFAVGGQIVGRETISGSELGPGFNNFTLNLGKASTAFVGDSSIFGFISPVKGTRYRYEVETLTGDLKFSTGLADWRKYWFAKPVTFAIRGLYYGRFGSDAESGRLNPLYLGQGSLVRGYEPWNIDPTECGTGVNCPVFDRLVGSKIAAAGMEIRAPLFGPPQFGLFNVSFLPTEIFGFADAGAAWTSNESVTWKWATSTNERVPVLSAGIGVRILLSYIPLEFYAAKAFQRPTEGTVYGFNIVPGW